MFTPLCDTDAIRAEINQGADKATAYQRCRTGFGAARQRDNDFLIRMGISRSYSLTLCISKKAVAGAAATSRLGAA